MLLALRKQTWRNTCSKPLAQDQPSKSVLKIGPTSGWSLQNLPPSKKKSHRSTKRPYLSRTTRLLKTTENVRLSPFSPSNANLTMSSHRRRNELSCSIESRWCQDYEGLLPFTRLRIHSSFQSHFDRFSGWIDLLEPQQLRCGSPSTSTALRIPGRFLTFRFTVPDIRNLLHHRFARYHHFPGRAPIHRWREFCFYFFAVASGPVISLSGTNDLSGEGVPWPSIGLLHKFLLTSMSPPARNFHS